MRKPLHLLFVSLCCALLVAPAIATVRPFVTQAPLTGVVAEAKRPPLTLASAMDETYQRGFVGWFEQSYGVRPTATRIDESIAYWLFGEAPPDKTVVVGSKGVLYIDEQIRIFNHHGEGARSAAVFASTLARAQRVMQQRGQVLLYIIVPTKGTVWPDDVPAAWQLPLPTPRPYVTKLSEPLVAELTKAGARFVDGRRTLGALAREQPEAVYAKTARHASSPAMCLLLEEAFASARPLLSAWTIPPLDCSFAMRTDAPLASPDYDLYRLLNVWPARPATPIAVSGPAADRVPRARRPNMFVVGSSFGWPIIVEAERNHAVARMQFHYYMETLFEWGGDHAPVKTGSQAWRDAVAASPLIVMPVPEEFLSRDVNELFQPLIDAFEVAGDGAAP
jgi:hypothetical protein